MFSESSAFLLALPWAISLPLWVIHNKHKYLYLTVQSNLANYIRSYTSTHAYIIVRTYMVLLRTLLYMYTHMFKECKSVEEIEQDCLNGSGNLAYYANNPHE